MSAAIYQPTTNLDPNPEGLYTLDEIRALLRHWGMPDTVRVLSDGRVVPAGWDASQGDPEVYATRERAEPSVARGQGQRAGGATIGARLDEQQTVEVMAAVETLEAAGMTRSDAYRELLLRGAWSVSNRR